MPDYLWILVASFAPLIMGAFIPLILLWAQRHRISAKKAGFEVLGLKQRLTDAQKYEVLGAMVAGLVHDLNNVGMAVQGNLAQALRCPELPEEASVPLQRALDVTRKGAGVMRNLLRFSTGTDAAVTVQDIRPTLVEVKEIIRLLLPKSVHLRMPIAEEPILLRCSQFQLFQVIMNLSVNAKDAIGDGPGIVLVSVQDLGDFVVVEVTDSGCGIPDAIRDRIFEWQFTTKPAGQGSGLGLAILADAVKAMKGAIKVHSEVGKGSTFTILLPHASY